jgi:hypothetical protein
MKPLSMIEAANRYQEQFEKRRRARLLGLAIDQGLQNIKNIIVFTEPAFWPEDDKDICLDVKKLALKTLDDLLIMEQKLLSLADIYATMVPSNKELRSMRGENPTEDKD